MAICLDWSRHPIGPLRPCRCCGRPALMRDQLGRACHKVCAELAADQTPGRGDQADPLAVVVALPAAPVIDLRSRRRIA